MRHRHSVEIDFVEMIITVGPADRANLDAVACHRDRYDADARMLGMQWPGTDECIHPVGNLRLARPDLVTVDHQLVAIDLSAGPQRCEIGPCRSEERRVGKECVSTCRSRWSRYH